MDTLESMLMQNDFDPYRVSRQEIMCAIVRIELGHELPDELRDRLLKRTFH